MRERLQKLISARGVASRRKAEELILSGEVLVNGHAAVLGQLADPDVDEILISGQALPAAASHVYLMLNKPRGVVTTLSDEKGRPNAAQLVADCGVRVWPVGRLDMDSEGLLLFTNDGAFLQDLAHPSHRINKIYHVWVNGFCADKLELLRRRVTLDGYTIATPGVKAIWVEGDRAKLEVIIHEGRNRQIRRMCAMANLGVHRLQRVAEGELSLGPLPTGSWRYLTEDEVRSLTQR